MTEEDRAAGIPQNRVTDGPSDQRTRDTVEREDRTTDAPQTANADERPGEGRDDMPRDDADLERAGQVRGGDPGQGGQVQVAPGQVAPAGAAAKEAAPEEDQATTDRREHLREKPEANGG